MHELPDPPSATLSPIQRHRRDSAARTLAASRIANLATLDAAGSIMLIENLRAALDETLRLLDECSN